MISKVICNTGPLIALSIIDHVDILQSLFQSVFIPKAVHMEILEGGAINAGLANYRKSKWIKVIELSNLPDPLLRTSLDAGEAAVIGLATELSVSRVLIDERKARKIARTVYGLHVIGSARVLVEAKRHGLIENVGVALQAMRDGGYWIDDSVVNAALKQAEES